jgi:hypothetical protein
MTSEPKLNLLDCEKLTSEEAEILFPRAIEQARRVSFLFVSSSMSTGFGLDSKGLLWRFCYRSDYVYWAYYWDGLRRGWVFSVSSAGICEPRLVWI